MHIGLFIQAMTERIRGRKLQQIRHRWFSMHPLCVRCEAKGSIRAATQLDHIIALVNGGKDEDSNYQGLCDDCHKDKTAEDLGQTRRPAIGADGWPVG